MLTAVTSLADYNGRMVILFLHGWQSVVGGVKPTYLKDHGHTVINPALPDEDFAEAVRIAQAEFDKHRPQVVVGSSRGGAVAMNINSGDARLVLICPAWIKYGTAKSIKNDSYVLHSRADDVVPFADSEELVRNSGLPVYVLMETGNDHRLADPESLDLMLDCCSDDDDDKPTQPADERHVMLRDWTGLCYTAALAWLGEADEEDWVVVHGTVVTGKEQRRIAHAWCERGDLVVDLAQPAENRMLMKEVYYKSAKPEVHKVYSREEALILAIKSRHDGPWDEPV